MGAVALGVAVRAALALAPPLGGDALRLPDSVSYDHAARSLVERGELWFSSAQRAKREPGYPLLMAGCYALFGPHPVAVRLVQAVVGALLCLPVYGLARQLGGRRSGRVAAWVVALDPYLASASALVLTEAVSATLLWLAVWATTAAALDRRASPSRGLAWAGPAAKLPAPRRLLMVKWLLAAGLAWGALAAVRSETLVIFSAVAAASLVVWRRRAPLVPRLAAGLAGLVLVTGLWAWRNARVVGRPVLTTLNVGETLYDSLWAGADGGSNKAFMQEVMAGAEWAGLDEVGRDRWLRDHALDYARSHPGHVVRLALRKAARTWSPVPNVRVAGRAVDAVLAGAFLAVAAGGLAGCVRHRRRWRTWAVWAVPVLVVAGLHLVIVGSVRYRVPVMPFFMVMAGAALARREETHREEHGGTGTAEWPRRVGAPRADERGKNEEEGTADERR